MDKETLSNYGWIVICVLVLAVLLALATPFGGFISTAIENTTQGLFATEKGALGAAGIDAGELVFGNGGSDSNNIGNATIEIRRNGTVPEGGQYKIMSKALWSNVGDAFPVPIKGDVYEEGDYEYTYNGSYGIEWSVKVKEKTKTEYGTIISEIAGKPVTDMTETSLDIV